MTPEQEARIIAAIRAERRTVQQEGLDRSGFTPIGRNAADHILSEPLTANGATRRYVDHFASLTVDARATAIAVSSIAAQVSELARKQGVTVDEQALAAAVVAGLGAQVDASVHAAIERVRVTLTDEDKDAIAAATVDELAKALSGR